MLKKLKILIFSHLIPVSLRFKLVNLKFKIFSQDNKYYSQCGEDVVLASIFANQNEGYYVDVGAHHPTRYSNTHLLHNKGWKGINIDANPYSIKLFKRARPKDINITSGIAEKEGTMMYWMFSDPAVNSFSDTDAQKWLGKSWIKLIKKEHVSVVPLKYILEKYLPPHTEIDLLNIDVEGLDFQVLQSNDWSKFNPKVIVVEVGNSDPQSQLIMPFLEDRGYKFYIHMGFSAIFVKR